MKCVWRNTRENQDVTGSLQLMYTCFEYAQAGASVPSCGDITREGKAACAQTGPNLEHGIADGVRSSVARHRHNCMRHSGA
jgi:hypothetical protein